MAFDYAAASQLIRHGTNGLLAPLGDEAAFVTQAGRLASDHAQAAAMGGLARATALSQQWSQVIAQVEQHMVDAQSRQPAAAAGPWLTARPRVL